MRTVSTNGGCRTDFRFPYDNLPCLNVKPACVWHIPRLRTGNVRVRRKPSACYRVCAVSFAANSLGIEANLSKTRQMDVTDKLLCDKLLKTPRLFAYNKDLTAN
ncbi:hypothetical protein [Treponema endosymbiont of Eucomonympha sp.]|jgi:hypothetical protein|uniref:hypothetical protein n=1 Tax=Treponema endosymbiont of Eucomonympha sp. TaxID=1580831 RepID=UPI001396782B|nr:hypothetical protein [Treponema endosymbiont of Eucomonympha sp.]